MYKVTYVFVANKKDGKTEYDVYRRTQFLWIKREKYLITLESKQEMLDFMRDTEDCVNVEMTVRDFFDAE